MTRRLTVVFSAFEALLAIAIGLALPLAPLTLLWAVQFGFGPPWADIGRAGVDVWLLGHGVDVRFTLDPALAATLGLPGAADPVPVTLALLGGALVTLLLAVRAGERLAESGRAVLGIPVAVAVVALVSGGLAMLVALPAARPSFSQAVVLPALVFAAGAVVGAVRGSARAGASGTGDGRGPSRLAAWARERWADLPALPRLVAVDALRAGAATAALTIAVSALVLALALAAAYADVIRLYEALHTEWLGGLLVTAGELALLPDLVIWTASWLIGPGFALGTGSHVSPLGTALGPVPPIPVLGALPSADLAFAYAGLLVPVGAAFLIGVGVRRAHDGRRRAAGLERARAGETVLLALAGGVATGLALGLLAAAASGAAGPGRLQQVGPDPLAVGLVAAALAALGLAVGSLTAGLLPTREGARGAGIRSSPGD
ncbi:MAG: hypothetical protein J0G30_05040 [Actinomycetales bacterium]|nr:hypothetical protein [Actinomycetales bacterium]